MLSIITAAGFDTYPLLVDIYLITILIIFTTSSEGTINQQIKPTAGSPTAERFQLSIITY